MFRKDLVVCIAADLKTRLIEDAEKDVQGTFMLAEAFIEQMSDLFQRFMVSWTGSPQGWTSLMERLKCSSWCSKIAG